jgi:sortase A
VSVVDQHRRGGWARAVGILGELLITAGVFFLLIVVYDLWWTNVVAARAAQDQRAALVGSWSADDLPLTGTPEAVVPVQGEPMGLMYIPRLRDTVWGLPIINGVGDRELAQGIGHFPDSAVPGEIGNFAVAGHRATHGEPLRSIDLLQPGDMVYVQTEFGWYSYRLTRTALVAPTDVQVVAPDPFAPAGAAPTEAIITIVTCHPRWGSTQRWIWWGDSTEVRLRAQGPPAELAAAGVGA